MKVQMNEKEADTLISYVQERNDLRESNTKLSQTIKQLEDHVKFLEKEIETLRYNPLIGALPRE